MTGSHLIPICIKRSKMINCLMMTWVGQRRGLVCKIRPTLWIPVYSHPRVMLYKIIITFKYNILYCSNEIWLAQLLREDEYLAKHLIGRSCAYECHARITSDDNLFNVKSNNIIMKIKLFNLSKKKCCETPTFFFSQTNKTRRKTCGFLIFCLFMYT